MHWLTSCNILALKSNLTPQNIRSSSNLYFRALYFTCMVISFPVMFFIRRGERNDYMLLIVYLPIFAKTYPPGFCLGSGAARISPRGRGEGASVKAWTDEWPSQ